MSLFVFDVGYGQALSISGEWTVLTNQANSDCMENFSIKVLGRDVEIRFNEADTWVLKESENWVSEEGTRYMIWRDYPTILEIFEEQRVNKPEFESKSIRLEHCNNQLIVTFSNNVNQNAQETICRYSSY